MTIEDERSATFPASFFSDDIPSSFWREKDFDVETHL